MRSGYLLVKMANDKRDDLIQQSDRERLLRSIEGTKPGLKFRLCERLAGILLALSHQVKEQAQVKPVDEFSAVEVEQMLIASSSRYSSAPSLLKGSKTSQVRR